MPKLVKNFLNVFNDQRKISYSLPNPIFTISSVSVLHNTAEHTESLV